MQRKDAGSKATLVKPLKNHATSFIHVSDSRNRKIPGLWVCNRRYYACLWVDRGDGKKTSRRLPLVAANVTEAREQMDIKKNDRRENKLPTSARKPMLAGSVDVGYDETLTLTLFCVVSRPLGLLPTPQVSDPSPASWSPMATGRRYPADTGRLRRYYSQLTMTLKSHFFSDELYLAFCSRISRLLHPYRIGPSLQRPPQSRFVSSPRSDSLLYVLLEHFRFSLTRCSG